MPTVTLTAVFTDPLREFAKKVYAQGLTLGVNFATFPAPFIYLDSASPLGALAAFPLGTAVTVGQKFAYSADTAQLRCYWEVTGAGTTGGTQPTVGTPDLTANIATTSGTATIVQRRHTGWARARSAIGISNLGVPAIFPQLTINVNSSGQDLRPWVALFASGYTQTLSTTPAPLLTLTQPGSTRVNSPAQTVISVDKSVAIPVAMTAGASVLGTGNGKGLQFDGAQALGLVRGMTLGHDNTASTASVFADQYVWSNNVRFYDCTFQTFRANNANATIEEYAHSGGRHAMRCTYKSSHATAPNPALGLSNTDTILEFPTITRLTSVATPVVRAPDTSTGATPTWPSYANGVMLLGADLSTFTGGPAFAAESLAAQVMKYGGAFRTFGALLKASPAYTSPAVAPTEVALSSQNNVIAGEFLPSVREYGSHYDNNYNTENLSVNSAATGAPAIQRNTTFTRSGGASDAFGAFAYACQITEYPDYPLTLEFFNSKIDESFLVTIEFQWSSTGTGLTALRDEDVWLEAAFLDDATKNSASLVFSFDKYNRRGLIYNDPVGPPALATSVATWAGALGSAVKQKVSVVVSPKQVGPIKLWVGTWFCPYTQNSKTVSAATIYIDPLPVLSAAP